MKAPLVLAFLCILALAYLVYAQQQELVSLAEEVGDLGFKVTSLDKPAAKPRTRKPAAPKETPK